MTTIILDLEWNGSFSKKAHGYFNEIIEIGAVKVGPDMQVIDRFGAVIRPTVSRKLTEWVTDLQDGTTFAKAVAALQAFIGPEPAAVLTWSNTDLMVLLENYRFFTGEQTIPFMGAYADAQLYFEQRQGLGTAQQIALSKVCEMLQVKDDDVSAHRAPDDCVLTARVLQRVYDEASLAQAFRPADADFYGRLTFKSSTLVDLKDPRIRPADLQFRCSACGRGLKRCGEWKLHGYAFFAAFRCGACGQEYNARVQVRTTYDGVSVKRKLVPKPAKETPENILKSEVENNGKR